MENPSKQYQLVVRFMCQLSIAQMFENLAVAVIHTDRHTVFVCICSLYVLFSSGCDDGPVKFPQWHENQPSISPPLKATKDTILVRLAVSFVSLSTRIRT
jgi:hypothetical protein